MATSKTAWYVGSISFTPSVFQSLRSFLFEPWFHHCCSLQAVPDRLVDHFGGKISGTIKLEAPTSQIFDVGVAKKTNKMILQSGWEAFVDANQMQENYFLVFRHLGMSCFKVTVFDSHGEEKISSRAGTKNPTHDENPCAYCAKISSSSPDDASDSDGCCRKPGKKPAAKYPSSDELSG
jgi:hypothetical protein